MGVRNFIRLVDNYVSTVLVALQRQEAHEICAAPSRPVVRGDQQLGLYAEQLHGLVDVLGPREGVFTCTALVSNALNGPSSRSNDK